MNIDWLQFTPVEALVGGVLIGLAAVAFMLFNGRIAGISGIFGGMLRPEPGDAGWRVAFIFGLMLAPAVYTAFTRAAPTIRIDADYPLLAVAGLLVGLGTRYASGCTSGHGVCGLSRLSPRSIVATLSFMTAGIVVVYVLRHVLGA